jgi:hypothetical protein
MTSTYSIKVTFDYQKKYNSWITQKFMTEEMALLFYYIQSLTLKCYTRQFRLPTYLNGNKKLSLIEACIG